MIKKYSYIIVGAFLLLVSYVFFGYICYSLKDLEQGKIPFESHSFAIISLLFIVSFFFALIASLCFVAYGRQRDK